MYKINNNFKIEKIKKKCKNKIQFNQIKLDRN